MCACVCISLTVFKRVLFASLFTGQVYSLVQTTHSLAHSLTHTHTHAPPDIILQRHNTKMYYKYAAVKQKSIFGAAIIRSHPPRFVRVVAVPPLQIIPISGGAALCRRRCCRRPMRACVCVCLSNFHTKHARASTPNVDHHLHN